MSKKKSLLLKAVILLSLFAANVVAATPNSRCNVRARLLLSIITLNIGGVVTADGQSCRPLSLPDILGALGTGVRCGANDVVPGVARITVTCPN
jgi:hypothetical protein